MNSNRILRGFAISLTVAVIVFVGAYIVLEITKVLLNNHNLAIAFAIAIPLLFVFYSSIIILYLIQRSTEKQLKIENRYNLGTESSFYNYYSFQKRVASLKLYNGRKKEAYLIAFTASKQSVMRNFTHNDVVRAYNGYISEFLHNYFLVMSPYKKKTNAFCFYHGSFLVYSFGDENKALEIIDEIEKKMYEIASEKDLKIYVQPFFGVAKINPEDDLILSVEHASIARSISEQRFEGTTFYVPEFEKNTNRNEVDAIKRGLDNNEFVVYYQPKFSLEKKEIVSSEALVRWDSPTQGLLAPSKFIETAEQSGLIHNIDDYVFKRVCFDLNETKRKGRRLLPVSINFSMHEFYDTNFVNNIVNTINEYNIPYNLIEIEVTETTSQQNTFMAIAIVNQLRSYGIRVLMDDFGKGFSNLDNLMRIPFDTVKIDKSYIERMITDVKSREMIKFLINLCKVNNLEVIAEGVDSQEQVDILKKAHCDTIQGYYYSKPIPKKAYDEFLMDNPFEKKSKEGKK